MLGTGAKQDKVRFGCGGRILANVRLASNASVKPTRSLPNRPGRNIHPAGVRKVRRSKKQIEADREAALKAAEERDREIQTGKELIVHMNVHEEHEAEDLPVLYPQRLSTRLAKRRYADADSESEECFDIRVDDVSDPDSSSESDKEAQMKVSVPCRFRSGWCHTTASQPRRKRHVKGAAHQELMSRTNELRLAKRNVKSQAGKSKHGIGQ